MGAEHLDTALAMNSIGSTYHRKGASGEALVWHRKALAIYEKTLGTEHPDTARAMHNIGVVYDEKGA